MRPHSAPAAAPASIIAGMTTMAGVPGRQDRGQDDRAGAPGAEQELPFGADVPEAHPERERAGEAGQDQRRRLDQRVADDADAAERRLEDVDVRADRVAADEPRGSTAADDERDDHARAMVSTRRQPARDRPGSARLAAADRRSTPDPPPVMSRPISWMSAVAGSNDADDPALVHDRDPVGEREELVELLGDQQDRRARRARRSRSELVDALDRADVEAARRLDGDQQRRRRRRSRGRG